jgi:hypothetical protein
MPVHSKTHMLLKCFNIENWHSRNEKYRMYYSLSRTRVRVYIEVYAYKYTCAYTFEAFPFHSCKILLFYWFLLPYVQLLSQKVIHAVIISPVFNLPAETNSYSDNGLRGPEE